MAEEKKEVKKCNLEKVESLEDYFSVEYGPNGECRPCRMKGLAELYLGQIEGEDAKAADELITAYDSQDILTIAKTMDKIRLDAKGDLRDNLEQLNCIAQSPELEDDGQEE